MSFTECEIKDRVKRFITSSFLLDLNSFDFDDDSSFLDAGIVDSTGILEVIAFLETTFGITVTDDEITPQNLDSLGNIGAFVARKTLSRASSIA
ncbi:MAG: acyl carrier protein [Chitinivibrionales bacterium]|nr:acyl carrier protein [Chitinivibrionales bacterium]MBD3358608.1 acyl carrier protein [Chitinivibrionales bacterium]